MDLRQEYEGIGAAARRLGVSGEYVRRMVRQARIEGAIKTPLGTIVPIAALEEFRRERERKQNGQ